MEYGKSKILACIDSTKDACLYFDNVIPLNLGHIIPWLNNGDLEAHEVLQRILPPALLDPSLPIGLSQATMLYIEAYVNVFPVSIGIEEGAKEEMDKRARHFFPLLTQRKDELFATLPDPVDTIFGTVTEKTNNDTNQAEDPAIILTGLKLVDTSHISWRDLLEIRKDKESIGKLRRLRTFIYQNYKDKSIAFIQDDLLNKIEIYKATAKYLGLKTTDSVFKTIFNSSSLIASTAATIFTALSGVPITIPLSLGISSAFMLGNIGLELQSHKRDLLKFKQDNPVTYLVDIKNIDKNCGS
jgi:hypothetical protein